MTTFNEKIRTLSERVAQIKDSITTEEATKTSIIMPFFQHLGYDVFNPAEFTPEYTADVGIKKGEKVDYAIMHEAQPVILIEAKSVNEPLTKHDSQLFRYFGTTTAKFAILTNGVTYKFFTDLEEQNKMDASPFFEFDLMEVRENQLNELAKFKKDSFDLDKIFNTASELKYTGLIKSFLHDLWEEPTDDFVMFILNQIYEGRKTKNVVAQFEPIVQKSFKQFINELVNDKLNAALKSTSSDDSSPNIQEIEEIEEEEQLPSEPEIVTTEEEIQGYTIARLMLSEVVDEDRVYYRDNKSYFNILLDNNIRRWICRLGLNNENNKYVQFNDEEKTTYQLEKISDLMKYKNKFAELAENFK
ncbi:endonuclease [Salimicrobium jeotgali]|uniref:Endonuclease n=1 Tax=Salimicrobium jeotgali TaxID=1230341 RepID=K2G7Q8_9BACI|nr:type I restriction endonuclease [Salimicrobium jeotgali]AKG05558.1 endonuclease [Salimicrobium jeotgali]EKE30447.1 prophage Lp2 protein 6 [Salimicrobium jeotgali]MBM7696590.1 hypothetical protein [Salimicrobium jeotgali]